MKRPLVGLAIAFGSGIFIASRIKIAFPLIYSLGAIFLLLSLLSFKKGFRFIAFLFCLVFCLGLALFKNAQSLPKCHISKYVYSKNSQPYIIRGSIDSQPQLNNQRTSFVFKTKAIQFDNLSYHCSGNILVYLKGKKDFRYGEELILRGNLYRPFAKRNSRRQSYRDYLYNQGIWFILGLRSDADTVRLNKNNGFRLKRFALWLKNKMEEIIFKHTSLPAAGILDAMILGEKRNIPALIYNSMIKSGTVHILVVSGFNVGIVTFIVVLFLKLIRLPRKLRFVLAIPFTVLYCLITGASTPVVRATIMAIVFSLAYLIKREPDIYNSLSVAAIVILGINPKQLFDIGFQLSFVSVISIVYLYPALSKFVATFIFRKGGVYPQIKWIKFVIDSVLVSFSAWIGTMGFIAYYFRIFSPVTVLANLFIVPLASLITLCGFSLVFISLICPPLANFFAFTNGLVVMLLLDINSFLIKLPAAYFYL